MEPAGCPLDADGGAAAVFARKKRGRQVMNAEVEAIDPEGEGVISCSSSSSSDF